MQSNSTELVHLMISLALTNNNLIQLALHKVLMQVLKQDNAKSRSSIHVAFQFAHKLLTGGIIKLIDHAGVRQHAVLWA